MKAFFLRATCHNNTKNGIVEYDEQIINEMIYEYLTKINSKGISFTVTHNKAGVTPHIHAILIIDSDSIKKYDMFEYFKYIKVEDVRNLEATYRYLTHKGFNNKKDFYSNKEVCGIMYIRAGEILLPYRIPYKASKSKEFEREVLRGDK